MHKHWKSVANLGEVDSVCQTIATMLAQSDLSNHRFAMQLLVREALTNAIVHGSANEQQPAECEVEIDDRAIRLDVFDSGPGFDWETALRKKLEVDNEAHGRGLWIYQLYADDILFNDVGNHVALIRKINH